MCPFNLLSLHLGRVPGQVDHLEETVLKVADYSNEEKMKLTRRMRLNFVLLREEFYGGKVTPDDDSLVKEEFVSYYLDIFKNLIAIQ